MIKNKVVIFTGASREIDETTSYLPAQKDAKIVPGTRHKDRLRKIAKKTGLTGSPV